MLAKTTYAVRSRFTTPSPRFSTLSEERRTERRTSTTAHAPDIYVVLYTPGDRSLPFYLQWWYPAAKGHTMQIESERVSFPVGGASVAGYLSRPVGAEPLADGAPRRFPPVLVFMEIFGVNAHIRSLVDRIAAEGYVALAPDYYHRTAPGLESDYGEESVQKGMALKAQLKDAELLDDLHGAIAYLRGRADVRGDRIGAIGFCVGGHVAYLAAATGELAATASFYGGGIASQGFGSPGPTVHRTPQIKGKIELFFGGKDTSIPPAQIERIKQALYDAGTRNELFVYPDAGHGFFCDARAAYHQRSHDDAWKRVKKLFLDELHG